MSENMQWTAIINFEQGIFANYKDILREKECDRVYDEDVVRKKMKRVDVCEKQIIICLC